MSRHERRNGLASAIATGCGIGRLPVMPGTWGSLAAAGIAWPMESAWGWTALAVAAIVGAGAGSWAAARYARSAPSADPPEIVVDEMVGQWLALLPATGNPWLFALAFLAFRVFDILKPWPVNALERLPGAWGIMADDVAAGIYAAVLVIAARAWLF